MNFSVGTHFWLKTPLLSIGVHPDIDVVKSGLVIVNPVGCRLSNHAEMWKFETPAAS